MDKIPQRAGMRASRGAPFHPLPARPTMTPFWFAIGCLLAGAWFIGFANVALQFGLLRWIFWLIAGLGGLLIGFGLLLICMCIPDVFGSHRKRHSHD